MLESTKFPGKEDGNSLASTWPSQFFVSTANPVLKQQRNNTKHSVASAYWERERERRSLPTALFSAGWDKSQKILVLGAKHSGKRGRGSLKCASPKAPAEGTEVCDTFSSFCSFRVTSLKVGWSLKAWSGLHLCLEEYSQGILLLCLNEIKMW